MKRCPHCGVGRIYTGWAHGANGFGTLARLTVAALEVVLFPLIVAVLVVLLSRALVGLP